MKRVIAAVFGFTFVGILAAVFQPSNVFSVTAPYNATVRLVDSLGNVISGTASAVTASYQGTFRVVDSTGHVIDSFGGGGGGGTPGGISGNVQLNNAGSFGALANVIHAGGGTLATAIAACPAGDTACDVWADPGQTYTIGNTPLAIGSATKPVTLFVDGAKINCTGTAGADCIEIFEKGRLIAFNAQSTGTNGAVITSASTANITSLVTNGNHTNQDGFDLEGVNFSPSRSSTITHATLWLSSEDGFANISNVAMTGPPNNGTGIEVDDGAAGTDFFNDITFHKVSVTCDGAEGAKGVYIHHNAGENGSNVTWEGGAIVDCSANNSTPSTLLKIDGGSGAAVGDITFTGTYFETFCPGGDTCTGAGDAILINNVDDVNLIGVKFNGGPKIANCIHVTGNQAGQLFATGRMTAGICTDTINNETNSYTNTSPGDIYYSYPGTNSAVSIALPPPGNPCNLAFDATTSWASLTPSGDLACGASTGQLTVIGIDTFPITSAPPANTAGYTWVTDSSGHLPAAQLAADACTNKGCINTVNTVNSSPTANVYDPINPTAQGDILTDNGSGNEPSYQVNEAPLPISFGIDGTISNSTNRFGVCPATLRVSPGLQVSYPTKQSFGIIGGNPSEIDTYTFNDLTTSTNPAVGYVNTSGAVTFGSPTCSPNFDNTQGGAAFNRALTTQTVAVTIPSAATTSYAILACTYNNSGGVFTAPTGVTGWTAITGGNHSAAGLSTQLYELNPIGANGGQSVSCNTSSAAGTMTAAVWTFKQGPSSGEVVDAITVTHSASGTTPAFPAVTPTLPGDTIFVALTAGANGTYSAQPAPYNLGATGSGMGSIYEFGGAASVASGSGSLTISTAAVVDAYAIALKSGQTTCTLCTGGDKLEMLGPTTGTNGSDVKFALVGVK